MVLLAEPGLGLDAIGRRIRLLVSRGIRVLISRGFGVIGEVDSHWTSRSHIEIEQLRWVAYRIGVS
jgi:hypothetical protein